MIDFRKIIISTAMSQPDFTRFKPLIEMTTVKSDQKSNINKYCILFCAISVLFKTVKDMVVVTIATIINSAMKHVLNGSCLSMPRQETNFKANSQFPFNFYLTEGLNEA